MLTDITINNDLGHPLCGNLRDGHWLCDYTSGRLIRDVGTEKLGRFLEARLAPLKDIPRFLVPSYFDIIITQTHAALVNKAYDLMNE